MQIRDTAAATPDKPAIVMHPSGTVVTFGELEARANQLAHLFRSAGLVEGDAVAIADGEQRALPRGDVGRAPRRAVLRADQHPPHRRRGRLHRRQQQRQGHRRIRRAARHAGRARGRAAQRAARGPARSSTESSRVGRATRNAVADNPITPIDDEIEGDLLQYSSGTTGRPKGIKRALPHQSPAEVPGLDGGADRLLDAPRRGLPQPGAAVSHRPVGLVDADAGRRHHDRRAGQVQPRGCPGGNPEVPGDPRPIRAR